MMVGVGDGCYGELVLEVVEVFQVDYGDGFYVQVGMGIEEGEFLFWVDKFCWYYL